MRLIKLLLLTFTLLLFTSLLVNIKTNNLHAESTLDPQILRNPDILEAVADELDIPKATQITANDLSKVKNLWLEGKQIKSLTDIEKLPNLESLVINYTSVNDLSPIENLSGIKHLSVTFSEIKEISSISKLKKLQWLDLSGNDITNIDSLAELSDLRSVTLDFTQVGDLRPLLHSPRLYIVSLKSTPIKDLTIFSQITRLQAIYITGIEANNYEVLKNIKLLHYVMVSSEQYTSNLNLWNELELSKVEIAVVHNLNIHLDINNRFIATTCFIKDEVAYAPLRTVTEKLNGKIYWDDETSDVRIKVGNNVIGIRIDDRRAQVNGSTVVLESPPLLIDNVTYIPIRFFSEALGLDVGWDATKKVIIIDKDINALY